MHACTVYLCHSEYFISSSDVGPANLHGAIPPAILKPIVCDGARDQRSGRWLQGRSSNTDPSASVDRTCESASRKGGTKTYVQPSPLAWLSTSIILPVDD
jgi:hypothetical protein